MNRRLQQFLELEQLSPSRLADILGVQRSGISHILSGRNKPGYDFINTFLLKFPNINAEWLITGKGKPYKDNFSGKSAQSSVIPPITDNSIFADEGSNISDIQEDMPDFDVQYPHENEKNDLSITVPSPNKGIKRITLFYKDGSFEEFLPSK